MSLMHRLCKIGVVVTCGTEDGTRGSGIAVVSLMLAFSALAFIYSTPICVFTPYLCIHRCFGDKNIPPWC